MGKERNYVNNIWNKRKYISNGKDLATAGKIAAAGGVAYVANRFLNKAAKDLKEYSPGQIIRKAVTHAEKGTYKLDQMLEREVKKIPGGKEALSLNEKVVSGFWNLVGIEPGSPEKERTQKFYERIQAPLPYSIEKKTVTETRIPPTYNVDAANQKSLLGSAGLAINALLGIYAAKEGAKYFYRKWRGKK